MTLAERKWHAALARSTCADIVECLWLSHVPHALVPKVLKLECRSK